MWMASSQTYGSFGKMFDKCITYCLSVQSSQSINLIAVPISTLCILLSLESVVNVSIYRY